MFLSAIKLVLEAVHLHLPVSACILEKGILEKGEPLNCVILINIT